jgi:glycosyltransferase involved in cell wall biosynthesis
MKTLSIVISTYNRDRSLEKTILSVREIATEIIIVNNSSTDATSEIAKKYKAKLYKRENNPMLNINKNYGIEHATSDWVLYLDDDEMLDDGLSSEITQVIEQSEIQGFWIPRKNILFNKWIQHGIWYPDYQLRLFQKGFGSYPCKHVHEYIVVQGKTKRLTHHLLHTNYNSIDQYLDKMQNIYIKSEVEKMKNESYVVAWYDALRFPVSDFLKLYFAQNGWKDGLHGLVLALLQSFYSFLVFAKLWESQHFQEISISPPQIFSESQKINREYFYWLWTMRINASSSMVKKIFAKFMRTLYV